MDLVICNTPLQVLQIESLINKGIIEKNNFFFLFFYYSETEKLKYYFERLSLVSNENLYYKCEKFPFLPLTLRRKFKNKNFINVYTASVDAGIIHFTLSFIKFENLFTIDDGTANIFKESSYYLEEKTKILKKTMHFIFGKRYDLSKTKSRINMHYTIYKNKDNIIKNTRYNDLDLNNRSSHKIKYKKKANVFLGTVYDDVTDEKNNLLKIINMFLIKDVFYYIPHPRDIDYYFSNVEYIKDQRVSEEIILDLLNQYQTINIYGFNSSAQVNLSHIKRVKNYQLKSVLLTKHLNIDYNIEETIDLDYF